MGGSSSVDYSKPGYYKNTVVANCKPKGQECARDPNYHTANTLGNCCEGLRCNQVAFSHPTQGGKYFCYDQYGSRYDGRSAENACGGFNPLGVSWCNLMAAEQSVGRSAEKSVGQNSCVDDDALIARLTFGKITTCAKALSEAKHEHLSCTQVRGHVIQNAITDGLIDGSIDLSGKRFKDICCQSCPSDAFPKVLGIQSNAEAILADNGHDMGELAMFAFALVGVFSIIGKIYYGCTKKPTYTEVTELKEGVEEL